MNWYDNQDALAGAIQFVVEHNMCYGWGAFVSSKTPCYDYAAEDAKIPAGLKASICHYYRNLPKAERRELNAELALLLGERFYVRENALFKVFSRILSNGDPRDNTDMIKYSLQIQIKQRVDLLEKLA